MQVSPDYDCPKSAKIIKKEPELYEPKNEMDITLQNIWNHLKRIDMFLAICKYCQMPVFFRTSSWYLMAHLKTVHLNNKEPWISNDHTLQDIKVETMVSSYSLDNSPITNSLKILREQQTRVDRDLLELFIEDCLSVSLVEGKAFRKFVKYIPGYVLPNKEMITSVLIPSLYEETLTQLKHSIANNAQFVFLTIELWMAGAKETYLAVTAHYIDEEFDQKHVFLFCKCMKAILSKYEIQNQLKNLTKDWGLTSKVVLVLSDTHDVLDKAIEKIGWETIECHFHSINIIFKRTLRELSLYTKIKQIISSVCRSQYSMGIFQSYQIQNMVTSGLPKPLIQDNVSCWTSTYEMMQRFVDLKGAVQACEDRIGKDWPTIDENEWKALEQVCHVLCAFKQVTSLIKEQYMPCSMGIVVTNSLIGVCNTFLKDYHYKLFQPQVTMLVEEIKYEVLRLPMQEQNRKFAICTLLDPRYKTWPFRTDRAITRAKNYLQILIKKIIENKNALGFKIKKEPIDEDSMTSDQLIQIPKIVASREIEWYLRDETIPERADDGQWNDPGQWWREHKSVYPYLAEIYREKCNIIGANVRSAKHFSQTGLRNLNNLEASTIEKIAFLNANLDPKRLHK